MAPPASSWRRPAGGAGGGPCARLCAPLRRAPPCAASRFRPDFALLALAYLALAPSGLGAQLRLAAFLPPLAPVAPALIKALPVAWLGLGAIATSEEWPRGHAGLAEAVASARDAGAGLLLSAAGDFLLDLSEAQDGRGSGAPRFPAGPRGLDPRPLPDAFLAGMACFALAHAAYVRAFLRGGRGAAASAASGSASASAGMPSLFASGRAFGALAVAAALAVTLAPAAAYVLCARAARSREALALFASPATAFLAAASTAYAAALAATLLAACASALGGGGASVAAARRGALGAALFVASDAVLARDVFFSGAAAGLGGPLPHGKLGVMLLYYSAQLLIAESASAPPRAEEAPPAAPLAEEEEEEVGREKSS
jgi:hypothetical protein